MIALPVVLLLAGIALAGFIIAIVALAKATSDPPDVDVPDDDPFTAYTIYVDWNATLPPAQQTGQQVAPFSTIQAGINQVPDCLSVIACHQVWTIAIAPGTYDEDLVINGTHRRILLSAYLGPVNLGNMTGSSWTPGPGDVRRSITWTATDDFSGQLRNGLGIESPAPLAAGQTTNEAFLTKFRISGNLIMTDAAASAEVYLNCEIFGDFNTTGIVQLYMYRGRTRGNMYTGTTASNLQTAELWRFDKAPVIALYGSIRACQFVAGIQVGSTGLAGIAPDGFIDTQFAGNFTCLAANCANCFRLDTYTNYWFVANGGSLVGTGATKLLYYSTAP